MKSYDFSQVLLTLNNLEIRDESGPMSCGKLMANQIANQTSGPIVKLVLWSRELWEKNKVTVSDEDRAFLAAMIENNMNGITVYLKAQLLECLEKQTQ